MHDHKNTNLESAVCRILVTSDVKNQCSKVMARLQYKGHDLELVGHSDLSVYFRVLVGCVSDHTVFSQHMGQVKVGHTDTCNQ